MPVDTSCKTKVTIQQPHPVIHRNKPMITSRNPILNKIHPHVLYYTSDRPAPPSCTTHGTHQRTQPV